MLTAWTLRGDRSLWGLQILIFKIKSRETFPSATQVLSILLTTAATTPSAERRNSKERV